MDVEQPPYQVLNQFNDHIEIRRYKSSKWVTANMIGMAKDFNSGSLFSKLFKYINGRNDMDKSMSMTSPVLMGYQSTSPNELIEPSTNCVMSMGFYVAKENQDKTPNPTGEQMHVKIEPDMIVAVAKFSGYASLSDYFQYRNELINVLGDEAQNYDCVNMMTAGYDPPFKPIYRTNEVWLRKIR